MKKNSLADQAYEILKEKILTNEYKPGKKIVELDLSDELNMSRTPIRAALAMLENDRLLTNNSRNETVVSKLSLDLFLEIYDVYEALELLAVKLASHNRTSEDLTIMDELKNLKNLLLVNEDYSFINFLNMDRKFHYSLWKMTKNSMLLSELERINEIYKRYIYYIDVPDLDARGITVVDEHIKILEAVQRRDARESQLLMQLHLRFIREHTIMHFTSLSAQNSEEITL